MEAWLKTYGLEQYAAKSIEEGYDDPSILSMFDQAQMEAWASAVKMKPGHRAKLMAQWKSKLAPQATLLAPVKDVELTIAPQPPKSQPLEPHPAPKTLVQTTGHSTTNSPEEPLLNGSDSSRKSSAIQEQNRLGVEQKSSVLASLPADLQARVAAAQYPAFGRARPTVVPKSRSLRRQLVCAFVPMVVVTFGVVILAAGVGLWATKQQAVNRSREALQNQVADSTAAFIRDAGRAFENRLMEGVSGFLLPMVHTYADTTASRPYPYTLGPPPSYADSLQNVPDIPVIVGTDMDERHPNPTNLNTSSVFISGQQGGLATAWAVHAATINQTAHIDRWVAPFFRTHSEWQAGYIGTATKVYRYIPGYVSDKELNNYDPTVRDWYTGAFVRAEQTRNRTTSPLQSLLEDVYITPPQKSFSLGSLMLSLSHALYRPSSLCIQRGLTTCVDSIQAGNQQGVAAVQVYIKTVRELVLQLKFGRSGQAHLFMTASGTVIASPQWMTNETIKIGQIQMLGEGPFTPSVLGQMSASSGKIFVGDALIVYTKLLQDRFILVMVTSVSEVNAPINNQITDLTESADMLLNIAICVGIASMVLVIFVVWLVSALVVRPLQAIAADSARISFNIGSSHGMEPPMDTKIFVGEVNQLRVRFNNMLKGYIHKREQPDNFIRANPFCGMKALPDLTIAGSEQAAAQSLLRHIQQRPAGSTLVLADPAPITCRNRMKTVLTVCVTGPILVGVIIVLVSVAVQLSAKRVEWIQPVREAMIAQEVNALPIRTEVLQVVVESLFRRAVDSLHLFHQHTEDVWNAAHNLPSPLTGQLLNPLPLFYVPHSRGTDMADSLSLLPPYGLDIDPRFPKADELKSNFHASSFYKNKNMAAAGEPGFEAPVFGPDDPVLTLQKNLSFLNDVSRMLYFSNDQILAMHFADEKYESFRQFPYRSKESFATWTGECLGASFRVGYSPICRTWYTASKENQHRDNWVPAYTSASTGFVQIGASRAVHDATGLFVGVVNIDFDLDSLNRALRQAKLYEKGYAYVVDHQGAAVLHPSMNFADSKTTPFVDYELPCDVNEKTAFLESIQPRIIAASTGSSAYTRCGETWYVAWAPIGATPYVLVLTMPHSDLTKQADELASSLKGTLAGMIGGWVAVTVIALFLSFHCGAKLSRRFSSSLEGLSTYLQDLHTTNYAHDMPSEITFTSYELELIAETIRELLVALRFGNPSFASGDREKELQNYLLALEIVNRNQSYVGVGIVQNNIGNTARLCSEEGFPQPARQHLEASIEYALVQVKQDPAQALDTLGQRLFNLGLLELHENQCHHANKIFFDVLAIHRITRNGEVFARYAYALSTMSTGQRPKSEMKNNQQGGYQEGKWDDILPPPAYPDDEKEEEHSREVVFSFWMQTFATSGLALLTPGSGAPACIAMSCLAMQNNKSQWCVWALKNIPELSVFLLCNLAVSACTESRDVREAIDPVMREQTNVEWNAEPQRVGRSFKVLSTQKGGISAPRNFVFCLDVSGSMAGTRLSNCKDAAQLILSKHCTSSDFVALVTFGSAAALVVPLQSLSNTVTSALQNMAASGKTAFYDALLFSLDELSKHQRQRVSWLIALTDGDDNCSNPASFEKVDSLLRGKRVNIAVITVGQLEDLSLQRVKDLCLAAQAGGGEGKHFVAQKSEEISLAFEQVSMLMQDASAQLWQAL